MTQTDKYRVVTYTAAASALRRRGLRRLAVRFARNASGATSIEYGVIAVGIAVAIIGTLVATGPQLDQLYAAVSAGFATVGGA